MIRASACVLLVLTSMLAGVPSGHPNSVSYPQTLSTYAAVSPSSGDPNATSFAFNSTLANFDLYTNKTASLLPNPPSGSLAWWSNFKNTTGQPIDGTAFNFTLPQGVAAFQTVNWTLNIPKGVSGFTYVKFQWNGNLTTGTGAEYLVFNGTGTEPGAKPFLRVVRSGNFTGGPPTNATGIPTGNPVPCSPRDECFDASKFIGYNITLTFLFNSTTAGKGLRVQVSNIQVASVRIIQDPASAHWMFVNPANSTEIFHYAKMPLNFTSFFKYPKPHATNEFLNHTWGQMILSLYWPASYSLISVTIIGGTVIFPTSPPSEPLLQGTCTPIIPTLECTNALFASLNMTSPNDTLVNKVAFFSAKGLNAINSVKIGLGQVNTDFWTPGENMSVRVTNSPGVNVVGTQAAWFTDPTGLPANNSTLSLGTGRGIANYTIRLPVSPLGNWNITAVFSSGYDYGRLSHQFRIEEINKPSSFTVAGGAGSGASLTVGGILSYLSNSSGAGNVNAGIFGISKGLGSSLPYVNGTATSGLYLSDITLVNGVATVGLPVTMYFTLRNPTANQFSANFTIEHEWGPGQPHGVNATIQLRLGDEPFQNTPVVYSVQALLTQTGIHITVRSLQTKNEESVNLTPGIGTSAVPFLRQHFGVFKMSVQTKNLSNQAVSTSSLESPPYAYLLYAPLIPSQILAYGSATTSSDGHFSASFSSSRLLGAKNLAFVVLARDLNGIVLGDTSRDPSASKDSTTLTSTANFPAEGVVQQSITITLHLKSNSTALTMTLTINFDVTGTTTSIPTQSRSVTIGPGQTQNTPFTFTAPSAAGLYLVTFSSPQYGGQGSPLVTKSLQVSLIPSNLQILIPAAIGLAVAIVILGVYIIRRGPVEEEVPPEKTKPAPGKSSRP